MLQLSKRKSGDSLNLIAFSKELEDNAQSLFIMYCYMINDSLKATYKNISWLNIFKKLSYFRFRKPCLSYFLNNYSIDEIAKMKEELDEIEGNKKKVPAESKSGEMSQKD